MPHVEVKVVMAADPRSVYNVCRDMTAFAEFMENVEKVALLEEGEDYTLTEWHTKLQGRKFVWQEREEYDDENLAIRYRQAQGDLKQMEGEWILEEVPGGTAVTLTCDFEFGIPMLAPVLNPVASITLKQNLRQMLEGIKARVESGS